MHADAAPSLVARSVDASPRELAAKERAAAAGAAPAVPEFRIRPGAAPGAQESLPVSTSTVARRHSLRRGPGSWSSGAGGLGGGVGDGRSRSPTGFIRGGGSVGSPTSSRSVHDMLSASMQAVAGVAAINTGRPTEENRAIRRRSMSRRLSRGISRSASLQLPLTETTAEGECVSPAAAAAAEEAASESLAMGASPAAARAAAEAAAQDKMMEENKESGEREVAKGSRRQTVGGWMADDGGSVGGSGRQGEILRLSPTAGGNTKRRVTSFVSEVRERTCSRVCGEAEIHVVYCCCGCGSSARGYINALFPPWFAFSVDHLFSLCRLEPPQQCPHPPPCLVLMRSSKAVWLVTT